MFQLLLELLNVLTSNGVSSYPSYQDVVVGGFPYTVLTSDTTLVSNNGYYLNGGASRKPSKEIPPHRLHQEAVEHGAKDIIVVEDG